MQQNGQDAAENTSAHRDIWCANCVFRVTLGANLARLAGIRGFDRTALMSGATDEGRREMERQIHLMLNDDQELKPRITVFGV
ncbi:hypothetical protein, partial [Paracoccus pantotrophus]|uniref:hypothetical protein n=1 Tax=Paracoccus pantotrophus TaxID=82367 RepID=UPI001C68FB1B